MTDTKVIQHRPFGAVLCELREGAAHQELTEGMEALIAAVRATKKGGKIVLTVSVDPLENTAGEMVAVRDKIVVQSPAADHESTLFFTTKANTMQREDPRQTRLPLAEAAGSVSP